MTEEGANCPLCPQKLNLPSLSVIFLSPSPLLQSYNHQQPTDLWQDYVGTKLGKEKDWSPSVVYIYFTVL